MARRDFCLALLIAERKISRGGGCEGLIVQVPSYQLCPYILKTCDCILKDWWLYIMDSKVSKSGTGHRAPTPSPPPLRVAKTGKIHSNEEITPSSPLG
jgi:hypothetical protein